MTRKVARLAGIFVMFALGLTFAGAPRAQTTTSVDVRHFEVISVEGNQLVARDERGTNEYTVPSDFRFTVDGKKMAVSDLKPGMKGTATVTTTTTIKPVIITEIRRGVVLAVSSGSLTVRDDADGSRKRFTQGQLNERGIQIVKDGRVLHISEVNQGDEITATIVSQGSPVIVTEQEVQATLAQAKAESTAPKTGAPAAAAQPPTSTAPATAAPAAAMPEPAASSPMAAASAATEPSSGMGMAGYVLIAIIIVGGLFFFMRQKKA
jgi:hypothetical protein